MANLVKAIHQAIVDILLSTRAVEDPETRLNIAKLEYRNEISILSGNYLLVIACTGLAHLRITKVVEIVTVAIFEFT